MVATKDLQLLIPASALRLCCDGSAASNWWQISPAVFPRSDDMMESNTADTALHSIRFVPIQRPKPFLSATGISLPHHSSVLHSRYFVLDRHVNPILRPTATSNTPSISQHGHTVLGSLEETLVISMAQHPRSGDQHPLCLATSGSPGNKQDLPKKS